MFFFTSLYTCYEKVVDTVDKKNIADFSSMTAEFCCPQLENLFFLIVDIVDNDSIVIRIAQ